MGVIVAKSWWKWGLKMEECLKRKRKLIFLTGCDKKTPEVSWFFKFSRLHLCILAKSSENLTFFLSIFQKISQKWPISLEFQPEVVPFPPEVSWFFKFSRLHLSILAKSSWNFTFFASKLEKPEPEVDFSPEVSFFSLNF